MSLPDLDATESGVRAGRKFGYATVGEWVALNTALSDRAVRIYCLLRAHAGSDKEEKAWPAQKTLADMLGIKKTDGIGVAIKELVDIGAVEIEVTRSRTGRRNVYVVHEAPPDGYGAGPKDNAEYYRLRETRRSAGVTPQQGVTPKTGVRGHPPVGGQGSPPSRGSEPPLVEPPEVEVDYQKKSPTDPSSGRDQRRRESRTSTGITSRPPSEDLFSGSQEDGTESDGSRGEDQGRHGGDQHLATVKESLDPVVTAQDVTAKWVDTYRESLGEKPTKQRIGQVSREAKQLLDAGRDPRKVMYAAQSAASSGYPTIVREYDRLVLAHQGRSQGVDPRASTTDQRVAQALALAAKYEALDAAENEAPQREAMYVPSTRI